MLKFDNTGKISGSSLIQVYHDGRFIGYIHRDKFIKAIKVKDISDKVMNQINSYIVEEILFQNEAE